MNQPRSWPLTGLLNLRAGHSGKAAKQRSGVDGNVGNARSGFRRSILANRDSEVVTRLLLLGRPKRQVQITLRDSPRNNLNGQDDEDDNQNCSNGLFQWEVGSVHRFGPTLTCRERCLWKIWVLLTTHANESRTKNIKMALVMSFLTSAPTSYRILTLMNNPHFPDLA